MRQHLFMLAAALLMASLPAAAQKDQCGKHFGLTVAACQKLVDNRVLAPRFRAEAHKLCVADAREEREACRAGAGGSCTTVCEEQRAVLESICLAQPDPAACLAVAQAVFEECISGC